MKCLPYPRVTPSISLLAWVHPHSVLAPSLSPPPLPTSVCRREQRISPIVAAIRTLAHPSSIPLYFLTQFGLYRDGHSEQGGCGWEGTVAAASGQGDNRLVATMPTVEQSSTTAAGEQSCWPCRNRRGDSRTTVAACCGWEDTTASMNAHVGSTPAAMIAASEWAWLRFATCGLCFFF